MERVDVSNALRLVCALVLVGCSAGELTTTGPIGRGDAGIAFDMGGRDTGVDSSASDSSRPLPDSAVPDSGTVLEDECGDIRLVSTVYFGTALPTHVPMRMSQVFAVGSFNGCSGLLVKPDWVLTAQHCNVRVGDRFCMDMRAQDPTICIRAAEVFNAPSRGDMTALRLESDATVAFPEVEPVPILMDDLSSSWVGETAEAAGYGQQEDGGFNEREFTAQPISAVRGDNVTIDGMGRRGVCFGDSGGPLFVIAPDGSVRTSGVLSNGDPSCTGMDNYTRVDTYRDWIIGLMGPFDDVDPPGGCGAETSAGRCEGNTAVYCEADTVVRQDCAAGCGDVAGQNRCLEPELPGACGAVTEQGRCTAAGVAEWCQSGELKRRDCGVCGQNCVVLPAGAFCD